MPVTRPDMPYAYIARSSEINSVHFTLQVERQNTYNTKSNTANIYQFFYRDVIGHIIMFSSCDATVQIGPRSRRF